MFHGALVPFVERRIIKMKKTKIIITAAIMAALVTATACGGKNQASTATEAQTTTVAVKQVNSTSTENATDKQEVTEASVENTEASNEEVLVAEAVIDENQGNGDSVEEVNNTVLEEQPEENINSGWEDAAPVEQPAAPAEPSPAPEPVVTPQAPTATTLTDEERLVATGKWTKISEGINSYTGKAYSIYEGIDPLTGYKIGTVFSDGTLTGLQTNTKEEACAIAQAHRAT